MISGREIVEKIEVAVGGTSIETKRAIKYLGVIIDDRLNFKAHMKFIGEKVSVIQRTLAMMMPNIGGPNPFKRKIILSISTYIMLYACPIWSEVLSVGTTRRILSSVYRLSAIRQISGFRTVSDEAVLVLAKTIARNTSVDEMKWIYLSRLEYLRQTTAIKSDERRTFMHIWQSRWENSLNGIWI